MRLWHYVMIPVLPRQQLLGQHRECCALRGHGWGKKHTIVDYVFRRPWEFLFYYHTLIIKEMKNRGYKPDPAWEEFEFRGYKCPAHDRSDIVRTRRDANYPEHDIPYLDSCVDNLYKKIQNAPENKYDPAECYRFYNWMGDHGYIIE